MTPAPPVAPGGEVAPRGAGRPPLWAKCRGRLPVGLAAVGVAACATPATPPLAPSVRFVETSTLAADLPEGRDVPVTVAHADVRRGVVEFAAPKAGGLVYRVDLGPAPRSGHAYEIGSGGVAGTCEVKGKQASLVGVIRVDEWSIADDVVEVAMDAVCTPPGFEEPHRVRAAFRQHRPLPEGPGDFEL